MTNCKTCGVDTGSKCQWCVSCRDARFATEAASKGYPAIGATHSVTMPMGWVKTSRHVGGGVWERV